MKSGVFFVVTKDNRSFRLAIHEGEITHSTCGRLHGEEALQTITTDSCERVAFSENKISFFKDRDLVDHAVAFQYLFNLLELDDSAANPRVETQRNEAVAANPTRLYRGQSVIVEHHQSDSETIESPSQEKAERWYRGQRIS